MASRDTDDRDSKRVKVELVREKEDKEPQYQTVQIVLLKQMNLNVIGSVTGNRYSFYGAGSVVEVDERDVEVMLQKRSDGCRGCPSAASMGTPYFEIVR